MYKKQKRSFFNPILSVLRDIVRETHTRSSLDLLNKQYSAKLTVAIKDVFNINIDIGAEAITPLYSLTLPEIAPGTKVDSDAIRDVLSSTRRKKVTSEALREIKHVSKRKGGIDYKKMKMTGAYAEMSGIFTIDWETLVLVYNFTADDLLTLLINEIGKYFVYVEYVINNSKVLSNLVKYDKVSTLEELYAAFKKVTYSNDIGIVELKKNMDKFDNLSSEWMVNTGLFEEYVTMSLKLKKSYKRINNQRWLRLIPTMIGLMGSLARFAWLSVMWFLNKIILITAVYTKLLAVVFIFLLGAGLIWYSLLAMIYAIVSAVVMVFTASDVLDYPSRLKPIKNQLYAKIKELSNHKDTTKVAGEAYDLLSLLDLLEKEMGDTSALKNLFKGKTMDDSLEVLKNNPLYVTQLQLRLE